MSNSYNSNPISLDTDTNSWFGGQTLQTQRFGLRVWKIMLVAVSSTSAGTVSIVDPNDNTVLYPPIAVAASAGANTVILTDNPQQLLQFRDFKVTGLTATATRLYVWYRL